MSGSLLSHILHPVYVGCCRVQLLSAHSWISDGVKIVVSWTAVLYVIL